MVLRYNFLRLAIVCHYGEILNYYSEILSQPSHFLNILCHCFSGSRYYFEEVSDNEEFFFFFTLT